MGRRWLVVIAGLLVFAQPAAAAASGDSAGAKLRTWLQTSATASDRKVAVAVVACMKRAGFPGYVAAGTPGTPAPVDGYGISTVVDAEVAPVQEALQFLRPFATAEASAALFGDDPVSDAKPKAGAKETYGSGCIGQASDAVIGHARAWEVLHADLATVSVQVSGDRRLGAANAKWSTCFQQATGQAIADPDAARQSITDQMFHLLATGTDPDTPGEGAPATQAELDTRIASLGALQAAERTWAAADARCSAAVGLGAARERVEAVLLSKMVAKDEKLLQEVGFHA
jgi:hypothetical protein